MKIFNLYVFDCSFAELLFNILGFYVQGRSNLITMTLTPKRKETIEHKLDGVLTFRLSIPVISVFDFLSFDPFVLRGPSF